MENGIQERVGGQDGCDKEIEDLRDGGGRRHNKVRIEEGNGNGNGKGGEGELDLRGVE